MAVFTEVSNTQLDELLSHYDIGQARSLKGIASGIENSNFYLDTDKGKYVLTIFERLNKDQLPYYLELTSHLGKKAFRSVTPFRAMTEVFFLKSMESLAPLLPA